MDIVIKTTARVLFPFILLFGIYIAFHGHLSPGGGFPAGAILGTGFLLLVLSFKEADVEKKLPEWEISDFKSIVSVALIFIVLGELYIRRGLLESQEFFNVWGGGETLFLNVFGSAVVGSAMIIIIYSLVKEEWKGESHD